MDSGSSMLVLQFPEGKSLLQIDWIGILSRRRKVNTKTSKYLLRKTILPLQKMIGRVLVTDATKSSLPAARVLGRLQGRGALSGDVIAIDSHTIMVKHLVFGGNQPDTFFMVGTGPGPGPYGQQVTMTKSSFHSLHHHFL